MAAGEVLLVEVVYALPDRQRRIGVTLPAGSTVGEAIRQSGILDEFPEIDLTAAKVGIFSRLVGLRAPLRTGDRVEIYRPLYTDPKTERQRRARARQK
jgi:putative ubiquitin-RnfH superfamily antitoxin RatB of RatAB toxin-antitoxin module